MLYAAITAILLAADQIVKYLVRQNIELGGSAPLIPRVMDLTYWRNTGAAFSMLSDYTWILTIVSAVVSAAIVVVIARRMLPKAGRICLAVILAGAIGNLIDRALLGYVTDMFRVLLFDFAIFNVADICVTLGGIALCAYLLFVYKEPGTHTGESPPAAPHSDAGGPSDAITEEQPDDHLPDNR